MARSKGLSFYKRRKKISAALVREIFSWIFEICVAIFIAAVGNYFFGMTTNVVGVSMESTLYNSQQIFVNRLSYVFFSPKKGDVVIFLPNGNENTHYYVKRVLAVPGDTVLIADGVLYVNGEESEWVTEKVLDAGIASNELTLGSGEYFCLGDNVNNSEDSRSANIGPVKEVDIVGKVWFHLRSGEDGIGFVK
ncbi:MAG: signal peptidase I [Acetatifactor sp.]|nr:signal peptidase I [Acetatifactor sp.]